MWGLLLAHPLMSCMTQESYLRFHQAYFLPCKMRRIVKTFHKVVGKVHKVHEGMCGIQHIMDAQNCALIASLGTHTDLLQAKALDSRE